MNERLAGAVTIQVVLETKYETLWVFGCGILIPSISLRGCLWLWFQGKCVLEPEEEFLKSHLHNFPPPKRRFPRSNALEASSSPPPNPNLPAASLSKLMQIRPQVAAPRRSELRASDCALQLSRCVSPMESFYCIESFHTTFLC